MPSDNSDSNKGLRNVIADEERILDGEELGENLNFRLKS